MGFAAIFPRTGAPATAIAGDVTGTLGASVVSKVNGNTPTTPGLAVLTAASFAEILALLGAERAPVAAATTTTLPAYTRVANVLTANANGALGAQDGITLVAADRLLVKNETAGNAPYNGIYTVTQIGTAGTPWILTRAADADSAAEVTGAFVEVLAGTTLAGSQWVQTTGSVTLGTTALTWSEFGGVSPFGTVGGDLSGTLPNPTVAKVAGVTPGAGGLSILDDASVAAILATLGLSGILPSSGLPFPPAVYVQGANESESANSYTASSYLKFTPAANGVYTGILILPHSSAVATTGFQFEVTGPTNDVYDVGNLHVELSVSSEGQNVNVFGQPVSGTGIASSLFGLGFGFFALKAGAAPDADVVLKFRTEINTSQVTLLQGALMLVWRTA